MSEEGECKNSVLTALEAGYTHIDTARAYNNEHEVGEAIKESGMARDSLFITTKLRRMHATGYEEVIEHCKKSLELLDTDYIDLYYAHEDDPDTPIEATLEAFNSLIQSGKVRYIAASNFSASRLQQSLEISERLGYARYIACQDHYNLLERDFEDSLKLALEQKGLSELPYFGLAKGFLTGKYRPGTSIESVRASGVTAYQNERGWALLGKLDELAQEHQTTLSAISLAWLRAQATVAAPIASARNLDQLKEIMPLIALTEEELGRLT